MKLHEIKQFIAENIKYKDWQFVVSEKNGVPYVQIQFDAPDNFDPTKIEHQHCRKWQLSEWMTPTEIVQTCWAAVQRAEMHEAAEAFKYKGRDIFNTHINVEALAQVTADGRYEHRGEPPATAKIKEFDTKMYSIRDNPLGSHLCPICNSPLEGSPMGQYCRHCTYCDGYAHLNSVQAEKYKDRIIA